MTNAELISKIKAEIERLYNDKAYSEDRWDLGYDCACEDIMSFISGLESEKSVPNDLDFEQELYNHFGQVKDFTLGMRIAEYFYNIGCRRTAEKYDEVEYNRQRAGESVPNDLEEAARRYAHCPFTDDDGNFHEDAIDGTAYHDFIAAAKWQKEQDEKELSEKIAAAYQLGLADKEKQILKEAVEGYVNYYEDSGGILMAEAQVGCPYHNGDKVKIIIVKED